MNPEELSKREIHQVLDLQRLNRGYSTCVRCGLPWNHCQSHSVRVSDNIGIFALCSECWDDSDEEERITFYKALYYKHKFQYKELEYTVSDVISGVLKLSLPQQY